MGEPENPAAPPKAAPRDWAPYFWLFYALAVTQTWLFLRRHPFPPPDALLEIILGYAVLAGKGGAELADRPGRSLLRRVWLGALFGLGLFFLNIFFGIPIVTS